MNDSKEPIGRPFGQQEPLTTRLKGLVRSYPKGLGLFKEFIQNADDAEADEIVFVIDEQQYETSGLPESMRWLHTGPALLVYNNKPFSDEDIDGIQALNASGKSNSVNKAGRFGLGFNVCYNVTDVPYFITRDEFFCFDPHASTIPETSHSDPGRRLTFEDLEKQDWPLLDALSDCGSEDGTLDGVWFRLPFRTDERASKSEISKEPYTIKDALQAVDELQEFGSAILLFLKHIRKITVRHRKKGGRVKELLLFSATNTGEVSDSRKEVDALLNKRDSFTVKELDQLDVSLIAAALPPDVSQLSVAEIRLCVSVRTFNVLKERIEVVDDLVGYSDADLLRWRNFGETSLVNLKEFLLRATGPEVDLKMLMQPLTGPVPFSLKMSDVSLIAEALPPDVSQLSVAEIRLCVSVRTFNVLKERIEVVDDLVGYSDADLLRWRNFGETSLVDLKEFLLRAAGPEADLKKAHVDFFKSVGIDAPEWLLELGLHHLNFSVRVKNVLKSLGVKRLVDLRGICPNELLTLDNFGEKSLRSLQKAVMVRLYKGPPEDEAYAGTLLEAVRDAIPVFSDRDISILRQRFGLPEEPGEPLVDPATLEECGEFHQVTRERVRQIQKEKVGYLRNQRWALALKERLSQLLDGRPAFLTLAELPTEDPWFSGCNGSGASFSLLLQCFSPEFHCFKSSVTSGVSLISRISRDDLKLLMPEVRVKARLLSLELREQWRGGDVCSESEEALSFVNEIRNFLPSHSQDLALGIAQIAISKESKTATSRMNLASDRVLKILDNSKVPLRTTEILNRYQTEYGETLDRGYWGRIVELNLDTMIAFQHGSWGVEEHSTVPIYARPRILKMALECMEKEQDRQWSAEEIIQRIESKVGYPLTPGDLWISLHDSAHVEYLGRQRWSMADGRLSVSRLVISDLCLEILEDHGKPIRHSELRERIMKYMPFPVIFNCPLPVVKISEDQWGLVDRDLSLDAQQRELLFDTIFEALLEVEKPVLIAMVEMLSAMTRSGLAGDMVGLHPETLRDLFHKDKRFNLEYEHGRWSVAACPDYTLA